MKIEEIIKARRAEFEEEPTLVNWEKINARLPVKRQSIFLVNRNFKIFAGAAALICCLSLAYMFGRQSGQLDAHMDNMPTMAKENSEFVTFSKSIEEKKAVYSKLVSDQPALEEAFGRDLETLEADYQTLKVQFQTNHNKDMILKAMIENLKYQEQILNVQTRILEKTERKPRVDLL